MNNIGPASIIKPYELDEGLGRLLGSQREFIFSPERFSAIAGGYGSGKSRALVIKGLILSAAIPGNAGMFLCYRGTDLESRLVPLFEEVCPKSWIRAATKKPYRKYILRNNSVITFQHLHDSHSSTKSGRVGANLGWFAIDQLDEVLVEHWDAMVSRLRLPRAPRKFGFATLNPAGRDWIWERFFQSVKPWPRDEHGMAQPLDGKYYQTLRPRADHLGIAVNSEENRISNKGFVEDKFYDSLLDTYGREYVERYVWCSFNDFKGKLFPDYEAGLTDDSVASVHNIEPFDIPRSWDCIGGIDVGGESPWAVVPAYIDPRGDIILDEGFHHRTGRVSEVAGWIKRKMPWNENRCTFVIDPENRVAAVELSDHGIFCNTANKEVNPGILRMEGYLHVQKNRMLPSWYEETQPRDKFVKFREKGSPRMFVMKRATTTRKELDTAKWDPTKPDRMFKSSTARYDAVESVRYICMTRPEPSKDELREDKFAEMERLDPTTAKEWKAWDRRLRSRMLNQKGQNALIEMDSEEGASPTDDAKLGKYEWDSSNEF